jgi:putative Mg2+ transporter-C (MgtC) family protein
MSEEFLGVFFRGDELTIAIGFAIAVIGGFLIGVERESRGKSAGISTAYVVAGIGFLGGGMIIRGDAKKIFNLTTAASIWVAAAIGMAIGYEYYFLAILGIVLNILGPRIPSITKKYSSNTKQSHDDDEK